MLARILPVVAVVAAVSSSVLAQTGNQVVIPPQSSVYNGFSRGYSLTATTNFFIQDFEIPPGAMQPGDTAGVRVAVNGVEVYYSVGNAGSVITPPGPLQVFTGDVLEVVGNWSPATTGNNTAHNSYGVSAPYNTSIEGVGIQLFRAGVQYDIANPSYINAGTFAGGTGSFGRIEMYTTPPAGIFAGFTATPPAGASPLSVQFNDTTFSDDPAGVQTWDWDLDGDGISDSSLQNPTFNYASCGSYDVTLTVTDLINGSNTLTVVGAVEIDNVSASFDVAELAPASSAWQFTDTSFPTPSAWAWDFDGDGNIDSTQQNPVYVDPTQSALLVLPNCTLTVTGQGGCFNDTLIQPVAAAGYGVAVGGGSGGNGGVGTPSIGLFFDIQLPAGGRNITGLDTAVYSYNGPMTCDVWVTAGSHAGKESSPEAWTQVVFNGTGNAVSTSSTSGNPEFVSIDIGGQSFYLPAGDYGMAVYNSNPAGAARAAYTNGPGNAPYGNSDIVIHPNGVGCSDTGGIFFGGCNFSPRLWNGRLYYEDCAIAGNAAAGSYANGCANSAGIVPSMTVASLPQFGTNYELSVDSGLTTLTAVVMVLGSSNTVFNGLPLPLDLTSLGAPGCSLATDLLLTDLLTAQPGANTWSFGVPNNPALSCYEFFQQGAVFDLAANSFGFVLTNATAAVVGN